MRGITRWRRRRRRLDSAHTDGERDPSSLANKGTWISPEVIHSTARDIQRELRFTRRGRVRIAAWTNVRRGHDGLFEVRLQAVFFTVSAAQERLLFNPLAI
jgi:hypothetical protein